MLRDPARLSLTAHRSARRAVAAGILAAAITSHGYAAGPEGMLPSSPERPWIVPNTATYSSFAAGHSAADSVYPEYGQDYEGYGVGGCLAVEAGADASYGGSAVCGGYSGPRG